MNIEEFERNFGDRILNPEALLVFTNLTYQTRLTPEEFIRVYLHELNKNDYILKECVGSGKAKYQVITPRGGNIYTVVGGTPEAIDGVIFRLKGFIKKIFG